MDWLFPLLATNLLAIDEPKHEGPSVETLSRIPREAPPAPTYFELRQIIRYNEARRKRRIVEFFLDNKQNPQQFHAAYERTCLWLRCVHDVGLNPAGKEMKGYLKVSHRTEL